MLPFRTRNDTSFGYVIKKTTLIGRKYHKNNKKGKLKAIILTIMALKVIAPLLPHHKKHSS
jgi:hypothetical protein